MRTVSVRGLGLNSLALLVISFVINPTFLSPVLAGTQASFYVSPEGSDDNPGTQSAPFKTIMAARDAVRTINGAMTGDIYIYLRGGVHRISSTIELKPQDSGKNGFKIYYQAYPGEVPVISGAEKVTGWTLHTGNIYKAALNRTTKLRYLYVNDKRALMTSKRVTARGGQGTYSVTSGQAAWAWASGSKSDGVKYNSSDVPAIASNKDDLEIVNGTTWNENIACVRDVVTTSDNYRALMLQQPYGAITQTPGWGAAFTASGTHTIYNAYEFLNSPGQFFFDKTTTTLYYYPRSDENMTTADVEAPSVDKIFDIAGTSTSARVENITFKGITFAYTDFNLYKVGNSTGKTTCQGANGYIAFYADNNWHTTKYELLDLNPGLITLVNSKSIDFIGNVIKHAGADGINMANDVVDCNIIGNYITDITSSGITVGHPQHINIGDGGTHAKYAAGIEGICKNVLINNNLLYDISTAPGFGGCAAITAYFTEALTITYNHIEQTAYNGINLGWGWKEFKASTTAKDNTVSNNRIINTLRRLHDSGGIYTIGQNPGTNINQNYVRGIPDASSGPTYGLHNDEGSAYIVENDNVLDISPNVKYTINCEDYGDKHHLTILRTYATVSKMGVNPPQSTIDPIKVVSDNVWPVTQYTYCVSSGVQDAYRYVYPSDFIPIASYVFPASCAANSGSKIKIRSCGDSTLAVWFAPSGTTTFTVGRTMSRAEGKDTVISAPPTQGTYKLFVVNAQGTKLSESPFILRTSGTVGNFSDASVELPRVTKFRTGVTNGKLVIRPYGKKALFDVTLLLPDGRTVIKNNNISGTFETQFKARGLYIMIIKCDGIVRKNVITYY
ncbi:MAG TPA: right-handed parallel beta-helix repeat-containing protein [Chitinispirillaceae bacterium]|nr:right-handed parallel beta-helix repeat-containing protein [Chitinispirillaceae bacterium]